MVDIQTEKEHQIVRYLLQIGGFLQKTGDRLTRQHGLNLQQFAVLNEVAHNGPVNQKHIVGQLLFEKSNVSKITTHLHAAGLIDMVTAIDDTRARMLSVTAHGHQLRDQCMRTLMAWNTDWLESLNEEDLNAAEKILSQLRDLIR